VTGDVLLIDNLDSFTFNLVESVQRLGRSIRVVRNRIDPDWAIEFAAHQGSAIVISPGPGTPKEAGRCLEIIAKAKGRVPLLGICLGHQAIVEEAGGSVTPSPHPVHGKTSLLDHDGSGPFAGIEQPIRVGRYHSLCTRDVPTRFHIHGEIDGMAMAISDPNAMQVGLQFHPESILTACGDQILGNIFEYWSRSTAGDHDDARS
jgi:anthranilate synthase/aminodeoxychorismate synthase-like glutamine amidotransferase